MTLVSSAPKRERIVLYIPEKSETVRHVLHAAGIVGNHAVAGLFNFVDGVEDRGVRLAAE